MGRRALPGLMAAALLSAPVTALADACDAAASQAAMSACAEAGLRAADARLNDVYGHITARLRDRAGSREKLVLSERAWVQFRDAECAFAASGVAGGSVAPMLIADCRTALTQDRIRRLDSYLSCQEGDLSCPVPPG